MDFKVVNTIQIIMTILSIRYIFSLFGISIAWCFCFSMQLQAQELEEATLAFQEQRYETARIILEKINPEDIKAERLVFWLLKAKVYALIAADIRGTFNGQDTVALFKSYNAYQKLKKEVSNSTESSYADSARVGLDSLHKVAINIAGNYYKQAYQITRNTGTSTDLQTNSLYKVAFEAAELAKKLNFQDTLSHSIATYSAFLRQDYPSYVRTMKEMIGVIDDKTLKYQRYENLIATCRDVINDTQETLNVLALALNDFPDDEKFIRARIDLNEKLGENDEKLLNDAKARVRINPNDPINYFNLAIVYQRLGQHSEALDNYLKCINLDASNFTAIFNVGGIYFNKGVEKLRKIDGLTFTEYQKEGKVIEEQANESFQEALYYFELLYKMDATNPTILKSLQQIYQRLKMPEKAKEIKLVLEEMEGQ